MTDCRKCEHCEIIEYMQQNKIGFTCKSGEIATNNCKSFSKGKPSEVEWINA